MTELAAYWESIPTGRENAVTYTDLCYMWGCRERMARKILHELSLYDSGDDYILIRSSSAKGFFRTDDRSEIEAYKKECLAKGRSNFAPIKKINRILKANDGQLGFENNLRVMRENARLTQGEVCDKLRIPTFDKFLLSKMENNLCFPTPYQLERLSALYGCSAADLIDLSIYSAEV